MAASPEHVEVHMRDSDASYCGTCFVGVNIDTGAVSDTDVMMDCLRDGFDEVLAVGGGTGHAVSPTRTS